MKIDDIDPSLLSKPLNELPRLNEQEQQGIPVQAEAHTEQTTEEDENSSQTSDEESKVPYSRFKKFHDAAKDAEREAEFWRNRALEIEETRGRSQEQSRPYEIGYSSNVEPSFNGPDWDRFKALFGGADESMVKEAYRQEVQRIAAIEERAVQRASEAIEQRQEQAQQALVANRQSLDEGLEEAADILGRNLTSDEELALLEIQDEYSPKDRRGNIVALLPVEKAVEIYQLQTARTQQPKRAARQAVAAISSSSSGGDTSVAATQSEVNSKFVPQVGWRANFKRLTGKDPNQLG